MNRSLAIAFVGVCFVVGGFVRADAASPGPSKVGFVDLQRTLNETPAGKKARKKLESDKKAKQSALDKKQKDLQKFAADLDKKRSILKPDVLREKEKTLQEKYVKLQETYMQLQQELAKQEALLVREIFGKASPVIQEIAKQRGLSMVLEKNESAVLWADPALDITAEVNKKL